MVMPVTHLLIHANLLSVVVDSSSLLVGFFLVSQQANNRALALPRTSYKMSRYDSNSRLYIVSQILSMNDGFMKTTKNRAVLCFAHDTHSELNHVNEGMDVKCANEWPNHVSVVGMR